MTISPLELLNRLHGTNIQSNKYKNVVLAVVSNVLTAPNLKDV